jgi:tRNA A37 threonylcarbamoyltransferase TsaD
MFAAARTMTCILGISAFHHDSAAALVVDGRVVAAAKEEQFSGIAHDGGLPMSAIEHCLAHASLDPEQLDHVAFCEKPLLRFDRVLETHLAVAPKSLPGFLATLPLWLHRRLHVPRELDRALGGRYRGRYVFIPHHECHAAAAFFPSQFAQAAILTLDGVGEWSTATFGVGGDNRVELIGEMRFPHSLGLLVSAMAWFCGFRGCGDESKLLALAPSGRPRFRGRILRKLVDLKEDGSLRMDLSYFGACRGGSATTRKMSHLLDSRPRRTGSAVTDRERDVAASVQAVAEETILRRARHVAQVTHLPNCVLGGGVARNAAVNDRLAREGPFKRIWAQPDAGSAGAARGAALFVWHQLLDEPRPRRGRRKRPAPPAPASPPGRTALRTVLSRIETSWRPTASQLSGFGAVAAAVFAAVGAWAFFVHELPGIPLSDVTAQTLALSLWAVAIAAFALAETAPGALRIPYLTLGAVVVPISVILTTALLTAAYCLVLTPVSLLLRLTGRDTLGLQRDENASTYWSPCEPGGDVERYFRQF